MEIKGGLGCNVYPTVAEGVFAMTNQIIAAVNELRYPEYFLGLSMEESERPFISRNPRF